MVNRGGPSFSNDRTARRAETPIQTDSSRFLHASPIPSDPRIPLYPLYNVYVYVYLIYVDTYVTAALPTFILRRR